MKQMTRKRRQQYKAGVVRRPLKARDIAFLKAKASDPTMPNYQAAMIATGNPNKSAAAVEATRLLRNANLREALADSFEDMGFTVRHGAKAFVDALQANKTAIENGHLVETEIPDHSLRIGAARSIFNLLQPKVEGGGGNTFNLNFVPPTNESDDKPKRSFIDA